MAPSLRILLAPALACCFARRHRAAARFLAALLGCWRRLGRRLRRCRGRSCCRQICCHLLQGCIHNIHAVISRLPCLRSHSCLRVRRRLSRLPPLLLLLHALPGQLKLGVVLLLLAQVLRQVCRGREGQGMAGQSSSHAAGPQRHGTAVCRTAWAVQQQCSSSAAAQGSPTCADISHLACGVRLARLKVAGLHPLLRRGGAAGVQGCCGQARAQASEGGCVAGRTQVPRAASCTARSDTPAL